MSVRRRSVLAGLGALAAAVPAQARACDPNCHTVVALVAGAPTAAVTSLAAPGVARALAARRDVPYWPAAGISALASGAAVLAVRSHADRLTVQRRDVARMVVAPAVAGSAATALVYWLWPRGGPGVARERAWAPALAPDPRGAVHLVWRL